MFIPASIVHPFLLLPNLFLVLCCQPAFLLHYVASMLAMLEVINWCKYCISLWLELLVDTVCRMQYLFGFLWYKSYLFSLTGIIGCSLFCAHRLVTLFSSAVPSQPIRTASKNGRHQFSSSSWTVSGRSCASSLAPLSSTVTSLSCSLNIPTPPSLALFWATMKMKGSWVIVLDLVDIG